MGTRFGVQVTGGATLRRKMRKAGVGIKELSAANRKAASVVATAAKAIAPIGKTVRRRSGGRPKRGGALMRSIRPGATAKAAVIRAGGARVPYANPIHWGWPKRNIKPNYFLSNAAIATESTWVKEYDRHISTIIRKVKRF